MSAGALLLLLFQLGCTTPQSVPPGSRVDGTQRGVAQRLRLGLSDVVPSLAVTPHRKAPQFMLDLFNVVSLREGTQKSLKDLLDGNIVRSFEDKGPVGEKIHLFNLSSLGRGEKIVKAELRWFRHKHRTLRDQHFHQVDLYEVLDSRVKPLRGNFITSRLVPLHTPGWEVFNVTQMVSRWIYNSQENHGILLVSTFPPDGSMESEFSSNQPGDLMDTNTYLVIISDDGRTEANQSHLGLTPPAASPEPQHLLSRRRRASSDFSNHSLPRSCQRVPLFVDFEKIGWSGWIISPSGYNAYQCKGSCPFPMGAGLRATNHATVRSIMHALRLSGDQAGAPCCVPDRLQSISLLYFDDEENVVLKQFDDMVALSCGCH
ncbi:bone morphogenetic protein 4 [Nothobranchius furzeri]|uniref:Bone morphogenetic protein 4-like n=1 Tax=Nothobranchius furzeri TaxID=105023 RepID=A0A9D3BEL3_NOTFU|nr:bone morphogenetic protein 4-like [Nothobranchius furzeri]KAF7204866.1 bone morphogenetic protein 4-like [Nothobranchius furzeri]